jgi:hypothetical protein
VDATNSVKIRADRHDDEDNNFADGLSHCITKDGQTAITQNIPFNSRRIVSLADPIDPQDAATKDYADTKMPLDGSAPITGDVIVKNADPALTLDGTAGHKDSIIGQKGDKNRWELVLGDATAESGNNVGSDFDLIAYADDGATVTGTALFGSRSTALLTVKANPTTALGIATKQYVDTADATKLPITGGTVSGNLQVNGYVQASSEIGSSANVFRFGAVGSSPGYIQRQGGGSYALGGGGTIWHTGNFNPSASVLVTNGRLALAGDAYVSGEYGGPPNPVPEAFSGAVMTGMGGHLLAYVGRFRYLQLYTTSWFTVSYSG